MWNLVIVLAVIVWLWIAIVDWLDGKRRNNQSNAEWRAFLAASPEYDAEIKRNKAERERYWETKRRKTDSLAAICVIAAFVVLLWIYAK
jgi:hypothetical protein